MEPPFHSVVPQHNTRGEEGAASPVGDEQAGGSERSHRGGCADVPGELTASSHRRGTHRSHQQENHTREKKTDIDGRDADAEESSFCTPNESAGSMPAAAEEGEERPAPDDSGAMGYEGPREPSERPFGPTTRSRGWCFTPWCFGIRPTMTILSGFLWVAALATVVTAITVVSEKLYTGTIDKFGRNAVESAVQRGAQLVINKYQEAGNSARVVLNPTYGAERGLPTEEEAIMRRLGLPTIDVPPTTSVTYSWPERAGNVSRTEAVYYSTWRLFYTNLLNGLTAADSSDSRVLRAEIVFNDGTVIVGLRNTALGTMEITDAIPQLTIPPSADGNLTYLSRSFMPACREWSLSRPNPIYTSPASLPDPRKQPWFTMPLNQVDAYTGRTWGAKTTFMLPSEVHAPTGNTFLNQRSLPVVTEIQSPTKGVIGRLRIDHQFVAETDLRYATFLRGILEDLYAGDRFAGAVLLIDPSTKIILASSVNDFVSPNEGMDLTVLTDDTPPLTPEELLRGCTDLWPHRERRCPYTVHTYPYLEALPAAEALASEHLAITVDNYWSTPSVRAYRADIMYAAMTHNDTRYYVGGANTVVGYGMVSPRLLYILPAGEMDVVFSDVRRVVTLTAVGLGVGFGILLIIASRLVMHPVHVIAARMTIAASLADADDDGGSPTTDTNASNAAAKDRIFKKRTPSMWSEVYAIQAAYWSLTDELQALKAYIPEHLRGDIMERYRNRRSKSGGGGSGDGKSLGSSTAALPSSFVSAASESQAIPAPGSEAIDRELEELRLKSNITPIDPPRLAVNSTNIAIGCPIPPHLDTNASSSPSPTSVVTSDEPRPVYFADSSLIDRDITVVHLNVNGFHDYILRRRHPMMIGEDYSGFITYIHGEVKRFGGVLESFSGDKLWVSFNATTKCTHHEVSAAYFAFTVTSVINGAALRYQEARRRMPTDMTKRPVPPPIDSRFECCKGGVSCGISTGRALVGPVGNRTIKRHNIISNTFPEAQALERQARSFAGCGVLVTKEMLEAIDGYFQYLIVDSSLLPGSRGVCKTIASLKGPMLSPEIDVSVVRRWIVVGGTPVVPSSAAGGGGDEENKSGEQRSFMPISPSDRGDLTSCFDFLIEQPIGTAGRLKNNRMGTNNGGTVGGGGGMNSGSEGPSSATDALPPIRHILPLSSKYAACTEIVEAAFTAKSTTVSSSRRQAAVERVTLLFDALQRTLDAGPDVCFGETIDEFVIRASAVMCVQVFVQYYMSTERYQSDLGVLYRPAPVELQAVMVKDS